MRGRGRKAAIVVLSMMLLAACSEEETVDIIHSMEATVQTENQMHSNLNELAVLEGKDIALYDAILDQGREENAELAELLRDATIHVKEREALLNAAKATMDAAEAESKLWKDQLALYKEKEPSGDMAQRADELWQDYEGRQDIFNKLYDKYESGLEKETELYALLEEKGSQLSITELKAKVAERNRVFKEVNAIKIEFNKETKKFNEKHQAFVAEIKSLL
ncbi:YkyA family protein [Neobacillus mesonae]|nr:YkyA family protein [Neobacillus mesonae]